MVQENESDEQKVDLDVMSEVRDELTGTTNLTENPEEIEETWIEVKWRTRTQEPRQPEMVSKNRPMVQIFVKMDGSKTFPLKVSPSDKVDEVVRRIRNNAKSSKIDVYMTCEGRVLRWSDELRSSGVGDGCTVQIMNMMRGGGKHRNKKNRAEKKPTASPENSEPKTIQKAEPVKGQQEPKIDKSLFSREKAEDEVIRHFEITEEPGKIIANLADGNNSDMEQWIQIYTESTGLDDEHEKTQANGIRRAVEARRKDSGRKPAAAAEHGKKVSFTEEEREAKDAREWP